MAKVRPDVAMSEAARTPGLPSGTGLTEESRELQSRFVQENLRRIFLQIYRVVGNVDDAQDLTQETFIKALQRQEQIRDLKKAAHWLSRIATNTAIDFLRRHGRLSFAVRWHGERPALLWDLESHRSDPAVRLTAPALDPDWSSAEPRGEALLSPVPVPERPSQRRGLTIPVTIEPIRRRP